MTPCPRTLHRVISIWKEVGFVLTFVRNAGFKDKRFLNFFFKQLRPNKTGQHEGEYTWISPCGREMNYVAVEDTPVVFQAISPDGVFSSHADKLNVCTARERACVGRRSAGALSARQDREHAARSAVPSVAHWRAGPVALDRGASADGLLRHQRQGRAGSQMAVWALSCTSCGRVRWDHSC